MEIKIECPRCKQKYSVEDSFIGQQVECSVCKTLFNVKAPSAPVFSETDTDMDDILSQRNHPSVQHGQYKKASVSYPVPTSPFEPTKQEKKNTMKEYKVLTQKDQWFSGKFDPELLEKAINSYASQGWRVVSAATASFPGIISGNREELVIILERDK